jgi:hypothetical protein
MPSSKGPTPEDLQRDADALDALIKEARRVHREVTDHLDKLRRERPSIEPATERRPKGK